MNIFEEVRKKGCYSVISHEFIPRNIYTTPHTKKPMNYMLIYSCNVLVYIGGPTVWMSEARWKFQEVLLSPKGWMPR